MEKEEVGLDLVEQLVKESFASGSHRGRGARVRIVNAYLFGSRAHGLATPHSDYDVLAVVTERPREGAAEGEAGTGTSLAAAAAGGGGGATVRGHGEEEDDAVGDDDGQLLLGSRFLDFPEHNLNVTVLSLSFFQSLLQQNVIWIVTVLYLPRECVWKEEMRFGFRLRKQDMRRVVLADIDQQLQRHKWKGDTMRGKKNLMHALRTLHYALQLLKKGAIADLYEANHHWPEILSDSSSDPQHYFNKYGPIINHLKKELLDLTEPKPLPESSTAELKTLDYIAAYGVKSLSTELNLRILSDPRYPSLLLLHSDRFKALSAHPIVRECSSGLLLEVMDKGHRVICYPNSDAERMDLSSMASPDDLGIYELRISDKARSVSLYHYDGHWLLCSSGSIDGTEQVFSVRVSLPDSSPCTQPREVVYKTFRSTTHYNYWEIFEETLAKPRRAFANYLTRAQCEEGGQIPFERAGEVDVDNSGTGTLAEYFWEIWHELEYAMPEDTDLCYTFLFSAAAIHSSDHLYSGKSPKGEILLSSVRDMRGLTLLPLLQLRSIASKHGWRSLYDYAWNVGTNAQPGPGDSWIPNVKLSWLQLVHRSVRRLNPNLCSGYYVINVHTMHWDKVITPQYLALLRLKWFCGSDTVLKEYLLDVIRSNDSPISMLPEWNITYTELKKQFHRLLIRLEAAYYPLLTLSREEYVIAEKKHRFRRVLTEMVKAGVGRGGVRDHLCEIALSNLLRLMTRHAQQDE